MKSEITILTLILIGLTLSLVYDIYKYIKSLVKGIKTRNNYIKGMKNDNTSTNKHNKRKNKRN